MVATDTIDLKSVIKSRGHAILHSCEHGHDPLPQRAYTVGLTELGWPEMIIFGIPPKIAAYLMNGIVFKCKWNGIVPFAGMIEFDFMTFTTRFAPVLSMNIEKYMNRLVEHYGDLERLTALQLMWPDKNGHYPDCGSFDASMINLQPLMDRGLVS